MGIRFNIKEVLEMACEIERNGVKFYTSAQECFTDAKVQDILGKLARMEVDHEKTFKAMLDDLTANEQQPSLYDPEGVVDLYLQSLADDHVFDVKEETCLVVGGEKSAPEILKSAIRKERDSIVFYVGLKEMVPARLGKDKVDDIIREEIGHVAVIKQELAKLSAASEAS